jgi:hypothetical protein
MGVAVPSVMSSVARFDATGRALDEGSQGAQESRNWKPQLDRRLLIGFGLTARSRPDSDRAKARRSARSASSPCRNPNPSVARDASSVRPFETKLLGPLVASSDVTPAPRRCDAFAWRSAPVEKAFGDGHSTHGPNALHFSSARFGASATLSE